MSAYVNCVYVRRCRHYKFKRRLQRRNFNIKITHLHGTHMKKNWTKKVRVIDDDLISFVYAPAHQFQKK